LYFLRLFADGRKLEKRLRPSRIVSDAEDQDSQTPLITVDYTLWQVHPFGEPDAAGPGDEADPALTGSRRSDTTQLFS
jgi:hypothetical protein